MRITTSNLRNSNNMNTSPIQQCRAENDALIVIVGHWAMPMRNIELASLFGVQKAV